MSSNANNPGFKQQLSFFLGAGRKTGISFVVILVLLILLC